MSDININGLFSLDGKVALITGGELFPNMQDGKLKLTFARLKRSRFARSDCHIVSWRENNFH